VESLERLTATPAFQELRDRILLRAQLRASDRLLDIGTGTGLLAIAAAPLVSRVSALDLSPAMCRRLQEKCEQLRIENVEVLTGTATRLPLEHSAFDVVVSNYCFHHLSAPDKARALAEIRRVLRPGGRLVFGDMMFSLSLLHRRDRAVTMRLAHRMLSHGPSGMLRVVRNVAHVVSGRGEHPARVEWWRDALLRAGFTDIVVQALEHEGGIASARRP
jgi:ubiquinone/menaquinone biosynthesis C-methylase UbiE